jgi:hypothetical protein
MMTRPPPPPDVVIMSVPDLDALEETLDLLSTPGALNEIWAAEADIAGGNAIGAEELGPPRGRLSDAVSQNSRPGPVIRLPGAGPGPYGRQAAAPCGAADLEGGADVYSPSGASRGLGLTGPGGASAQAEE